MVFNIHTNRKAYYGRGERGEGGGGGYGNRRSFHNLSLPPEAGQWSGESGTAGPLFCIHDGKGHTFRYVE